MTTIRQPFIKKILKAVIKTFLPFCYKIYPELKNINKFRYNCGRMPNLINPKTLNEKILRKILFDRNPKLTLFADKYLVRDFVKSRLGGTEYLTKLYVVVISSDEIKKLDLPNEFVMKPNHLSGQIKIVRDQKAIEFGELEKQAALWLRQNYYHNMNEWAYKNIKPRIIFEELLDFGGESPDDYKFFCFNGVPKFIYISRKRQSKIKINYYDLNLSLLPVRHKYHENFKDKVTMPLHFDKMLEISKRLSSGSDFVRVDLYNINGRIVFGELTNYPTAGLGQLEPSFWDTEFGSFWK